MSLWDEAFECCDTCLMNWEVVELYCVAVA